MTEAPQIKTYNGKWKIRKANSPMDGERGGGEGEGKKDESFRVTYG